MKHEALLTICIYLTGIFTSISLVSIIFFYSDMNSYYEDSLLELEQFHVNMLFTIKFIFRFCQM